MLLAALGGLGWSIAGAAPSSWPAAGAETDTLTKLRRTGQIVLGGNDDGVPMVYKGPQGQLIGYQIDVCKRIVAAIRQTYQLPELRLVTVSVTQATRQALLSNGTVDLSCGHNPVTSSALNQGLLTHATVVVEMGAMTRSAAQEFKLNELGERRPIVTVGGQAAGLLRAYLRRSQLLVQPVPARDANAMMTLLNDGRGDVALMPEVYLRAHRLASGTPEDYRILPERLGATPIAIMLRKGDEQLLTLANEVIAGMMRNGEMARLYERWFLQTPPGLGQPVNLPLSAATQALFEQPGSEADNL